MANIARGNGVHAARELEVCGALQIKMSDLCGREEGMGNRMIEICRRLNMTRGTGRGVELPVFGYICGEMVTGMIDELLMIPVDPSVVEPSGRYTHGEQTSTLHLGDVKSRKDNRPLYPKMDHSSYHTQWMIYKSLLDGMLLSAYPDTGCTYETTFPCVFERTFKDLCLDVDKQFSDGFLEELSTLQEPSFSKLGCRLPKGLTECRTLQDLVLVFYSIVRNLGLGDAASPGCGRVSERMFIEYVYQRPDGHKSAKTFHHHDQSEIRQWVVENDPISRRQYVRPTSPSNESQAIIVARSRSTFASGRLVNREYRDDRETRVPL